MSVEAINWALDLEVHHSGLKVLLFVISNSADECGVAFPGHDLLARRCCCDPATVSRNMKRLEADHLIARRERRRRNGSRTSDWIVLAPLAADRGPMLDASTDNYPPEIAELARTTSLFHLEPSPCISSGDDSSDDIDAPGHLAISGGPDTSEEPADKDPLPPADRIVRYKRKRVAKRDLELAEQILTKFNELTGTSYPAYTKAGGTAEPLQRIIGAVIELDGLTLEIAERMIKSALADPYWQPGPAQPGHVFSGKVRDRNFQAANKPPSTRSGLDAWIERQDRKRAA